MIRFGKSVMGRAVRNGDQIMLPTRGYARPLNTKPPSISGSGTIGAAQSREAGQWSDAATITWAWFLDAQEVQQGGTYTPVAQDSGKTLTVLERAVNAAGGASARSAGVVIP